MKLKSAINRSQIIQEVHPHWVIGGSLGLILNGILPERDVNDIDFVTTFSQDNGFFDQAIKRKLKKKEKNPAWGKVEDEIYYKSVDESFKNLNNDLIRDFLEYLGERTLFGFNGINLDHLIKVLKKYFRYGHLKLSFPECCCLFFINKSGFLNHKLVKFGNITLRVQNPEEILFWKLVFNRKKDIKDWEAIREENLIGEKIIG